MKKESIKDFIATLNIKEDINNSRKLSENENSISDHELDQVTGGTDNEAQVSASLRRLAEAWLKRKLTPAELQELEAFQHGSY